MRRSNPVACFETAKSDKNSFKEQNSKENQNDSGVLESSGTHLSKSEVNFRKSNSKKRIKSKRKNSKTKLDCKSTREGSEKMQNFGIYGSILQNTRNKRKSVSRPNEKDSSNYYKDKYKRLKRMYEYERNSNKTEYMDLKKENEKLRKSIIHIKQDNSHKIS